MNGKLDSARKIARIILSLPAILAMCGVTFTLQAFAESIGVAAEDAPAVRETLKALNDKIDKQAESQAGQTRAIQSQLEMTREMMFFLHKVQVPENEDRGD